ncbi:MAG: nickel pincer cofactor biosynthesis protein LarB [Candidatus Sumerlaeia bacterium]|nr:nickel pincer cofactor biosynthesis protein LarB [Candidatus Sumerlaeia bacterium]
MSAEDRLRHLLNRLEAGEVTTDQVMHELRHLPAMNLGHSVVDTHRPMRCGVAEIIYCQSKTAEQVADIIEAMSAAGQNVLGTRVPPEMAAALVERFPALEHSPMARTVHLRVHGVPEKTGTVAVICAGTSDLPVAEEAMVTLRALGNRVETACDVGVAGIHRLLERRDLLARARVIIVVAGMEGALASVVGGLVSAPVIAVPTSIGYGASFGGLAALLAMLNSCAAGVAVVNIDNGVGAAVLANAINAL